MVDTSIDRHGLDTAVLDQLRANNGRLVNLSDTIAHYAEPGLSEVRSASALMELLADAGFSVERGVANLETAFVATWQRGTAVPTLGLMCEYDATPGDSQRPVPYPSPVAAGAGGFADLHNGIGAASVIAAVSLQQVMDEHDLDGRIVVFGTPAEKLCIGKPVMAAHGLFDDVDAFIAWHPRPYTTVEWDTGPGCYQARLFSFSGTAAYAAVPWAGVSALDAALLMNVGVQFMREHIPRSYLATVNEVITRGGQHPTSLPTNAQVWYVSRSPERLGIDHIDHLLTRCADAGCMVTGASYSSSLIAATRPWLPNHVLARHCYGALEKIGAPQFSQEAKSFAREMLVSLGSTEVTEPFDESLTDPEAGATVEFAGGADDVTEFTWHAPTARIYVAYGLQGGKWPSWTGAALASTEAAHATIRVAAGAVALSAAELLAHPDVLESARREHNERLQSASLAPLLPGDWALPDYAVLPS